ncbi:MAG: rhomboid family intramembrane serine protease [Lachnospiraceae bacterium]|nr:rhomboid family intramembrane serine protease [Lachnospiraceae bacterium]
MPKLRITVNAPATIGFAFICLIVMIINYMTAGKSNELLFMTYHSSLLSPLTYLRFFTHVLGHEGWSHFIGNMTYILLLGPMLEEKHSSRRIIYIILVTAFVTGLINYIFFPNVALCGASGVVFAFIICTSFTGFREGEIPLSFILVAAVFIGQQVYEGVAIRDNVSNLSHIIGGVIGAIIGYQSNKKSRYRY